LPGSAQSACVHVCLRWQPSDFTNFHTSLLE
jgi:hypothetical protein